MELKDLMKKSPYWGGLNYAGLLRDVESQIQALSESEEKSELMRQLRREKNNYREKYIAEQTRRKQAKILSRIKYGKALRKNQRQELMPFKFRRETRRTEIELRDIEVYG